MVFWIFCAALSANYLLRISAEHLASAGYPAVCLTQYQQQFSPVPRFENIIPADPLSIMYGDGASTDNFTMVATAVRTIRETDPFLNTYISAGLHLRSLTLYLCESKQLSIGKN